MKRSCKRILSAVLSLALLCSLLPAALAAEEAPLLTTTSAPAQSGPLKVLLIGNSLTADAGSYIPDVFKAEDQEIILGVLHKGDSTLQIHMDFALENSSSYSYYKYENGEWTLNGAGSYTQLMGLQDEAWDVVFLQQNASPAADAYSYDVLDDLIPLITKNLTNPNCKLGWYMTGAYPFGHDKLFNYSQDGEPAEMHRYIADAVSKKILTRKDISYMAPVGTALLNTTTSFIGHNVHRDNVHMNTLGRTIAAYTFYCTLTGKTLDTIKLTDVPQSKAVTKGYITPARTVTPEEALAVTEAVNNTIKTPLQMTPSAYAEKPVIPDHSATCLSKDMTDVDKNAWYHEAVDFALANKIMGGYNATTFGPNDTLSRAMVVQILYNKEGQPAVSGKHSFTDAPASQWYNNAIIWGTTKGVMGGYGNGKFGPDDSVTLEQIAVILWNYSGNPAFTGTADSVGAHSGWAANGLAWAVEKGLLKDVPYDVVTAPATRAQTAQILKNFLSMPEVKTLTLATGSSFGTSFAMGSALQNTLNGKLSQSQLAVISSSGAVDNIYKIEDGKADLALVSSDIIMDAHTGKNAFASGKETSALWVAGLYPETVHIVATPDITDVSQLRGKSVCMGEVGSTNRAIAEQILSAYGMSAKDVVAVSGSFQDGIDGLTSGKVDAAITVAFAPATAITALAFTNANAFNLVSLSDAALERLTGDYLVRSDLSAGTYLGINQNTKCVAVQSALVASEDVSEEVVYELLKAMFSNESALETAHNRFGLLDAGQAALNAVPMHPGAQKYYREIGILK